MTNETKIVPVEPSNQKLADRLSALATAVTKRDWSEFTMRIPADPKRDADLVLSEAARRLRAIEAAPAPDDEPTTKSESISSQLVDDELARLEREIAEGYAIAGIKEYSFNGWYQLKPTDSEWWNKKIEYLELRGLLERHPTDPNLVRLREKDDDA